MINHFEDNTIQAVKPLKKPHRAFWVKCKGVRVQKSQVVHVPEGGMNQR